MKLKAQYFNVFTIMLALLMGSCAPAPMPNVTVTLKVTVTLTSVPTETPIPTATQIALNISSEVQQALKNQKVLNSDGSIIEKLAHSENAQSVSIVPESIMVLPSNNTAAPKIVIGQDAQGARYLWNKEVGAWTPERHFTMEYTTAEVVKLDEVYDGSLRLSALLQYAENPEIIPPGAIDPHYKVNLREGIMLISRYRLGQSRWPDANDPTRETILKEGDLATKRSWGWLGIIRVIDTEGNEIVVMSDMLKNPIAGNPKNVLPRFNGFDKKYFLGDFSVIGKDGLTGWERILQTDNQEVMTVYPFPAGWWENNAGFENNFRVNIGVTMPHVANLQKLKSIFNMFSQAKQDEINVCYNNAITSASHLSTPEVPFGTDIEFIPDELSELISFPGLFTPYSP